MSVEREALARLVIDALLAQGTEGRHDAPYVQEESSAAVLVDGWIRPFGIADALILAGYQLPVEPPPTVEWGVRAAGGSATVYDSDTEEDAREWVAASAVPREVVSRTASGSWVAQP